MKRYIFTTTLLLMISPILLAKQTSLYCITPNHTGYIYLRDTMAEVEQQCGKPLKVKHDTRYPTETLKMEQWVYNYRPNSPFSHAKLITRDHTLVINFLDNKADAIWVEGVPTNSTHYCNADVALKLGDTRDVTYQLCFWPDIKQPVSRTVRETPVVQTILSYKPTPYSELLELVFEKTRLVDIRSALS